MVKHAQHGRKTKDRAGGAYADSARHHEPLVLDRVAVGVGRLVAGAHARRPAVEDEAGAAREEDGLTAQELAEIDEAIREGGEWTAAEAGPNGDLVAPPPAREEAVRTEAEQWPHGEGAGVDAAVGGEGGDDEGGDGGDDDGDDEAGPRKRRRTGRPQEKQSTRKRANARRAAEGHQTATLT